MTATSLIILLFIGVIAGWLAATMLGYVVLTQLVKTIYTRRYGRWP